MCLWQCFFASHETCETYLNTNERCIDSNKWMCFVTAKNTWGGGGQSMWGGWGQFWKFDTCGSLSGDRAASRCFPGRPHGHIGQQGDTYTLDRGCAFLPKKQTGALFLNTEPFPEAWALEGMMAQRDSLSECARPWSSCMQVAFCVTLLYKKVRWVK